MWLLVLILSIKLQMPIWYWILFTVWTIAMPFWAIIKHIFTKTFINTFSK